MVSLELLVCYCLLELLVDLLVMFYVGWECLCLDGSLWLVGVDGSSVVFNLCL